MTFVLYDPAGPDAEALSGTVTKTVLNTILEWWYSPDSFLDVGFVYDGIESKATRTISWNLTRQLQ